ncbi:MAG: phosphoglycerate kinase [Nanoarchaeota archaeon]
MKFISKARNLEGKRILLRSDINSDVVNGRVFISGRIKEASKTIKFLKNKRARIVVVAHQGQKGKEDFISLKEHSKILSKFVKIKFVKDVVGEKAVKAIKKLKNGDVLLLDNLRFLDEETNPSVKNNRLTKVLVPLFDLYVNDAFSVCHREHTSMVEFPKKLPGFAGLLLEKELNALKKIKMNGSVYILGGAKPKDYIPLLGENKVLSCGLFGQSCLVAQGKNLGFQDKYLEKEADLNSELKEKLKNKMRNVVTPSDFAVKINGKRVEIPLEKFPSKYEIFDIGEKTIDKYVNEIKKAKAVYMKGPAGDFSSKGFEKGTFAILRAISEMKGFSLVGGGHLSDAIKMSKIPERKFNHISLSGGALLEHVAGKKLPGLEALR